MGWLGVVWAGSEHVRWSVCCMNMEEHFRWLIDKSDNNIVLTKHGKTVPLDMILNGIIQYEIVAYKQVNGSGGAFDVEGWYIDNLRDRLLFGLGCANRGKYRGNSRKEGVHVAAVIKIINFDDLFRAGVIRYSNNLTEKEKNMIKANRLMNGTPELAKFVHPHPSKLKTLVKRC